MEPKFWTSSEFFLVMNIKFTLIKNEKLLVIVIASEFSNTNSF